MFSSFLRFLRSLHFPRFKRSQRFQPSQTTPIPQVPSELLMPVDPLPHEKKEIRNRLLDMGYILGSSEGPKIPPPLAFDPMKTIYMSNGSDIFHSSPSPSIATNEEEFVPPPPFEFDSMKTFGKYE